MAGELDRDIVLKRGRGSNTPAEVLVLDTMNWEEIERYLNAYRAKIGELAEATIDLDELADAASRLVSKSATLPHDMPVGGSGTSGGFQISRPAEGRFDIAVASFRLAQCWDADTGMLEYPPIGKGIGMMSIYFDIAPASDKIINFI